MSNRTRLLSAGLERLARHADGLALGRADDVGPVDLAVVDRDDQAVAVLGGLGPGRRSRQGGQRRALGLVRLPADARSGGRAASRRPASSSGACGRTRAKARAASAVVSAVRAVPRVLARARPVAPRLAARARSARSCPRAEDAEHLAGQRRAVEVGERQRQVGERRRWRALAHAVQAVGLLERRLVAGAQGVQERGAGLVVAAARPWRTPGPATSPPCRGPRRRSAGRAARPSRAPRRPRPR